MQNLFKFIYNFNLFIALFLILSSFRQLAYSETSDTIIFFTFFKGILLITFSLAGSLINRYVGKRMVGAGINILPWLLLLGSSWLSL